ncbi:MAG: thiamine pyrophosphate-binding protein [Ruminococcaceae bacterium]|nr:thiamine pyrophosphate-binding protein [Oscillospiraceae bacterium]
MKVSDYISQSLSNLGIDTVFGFQGSNITHIIDSISKNDRLSYLQTHHEQGAAFAANAYAQIKGKTSVCVSSGGPGALNLISGIANAWFDSIPCLFITGQLSNYSDIKNKRVRQQGFQQFNIVKTVSHFTKYAKTLKSPEDIRFRLEKALYLASDGRKGPVLLDIPHNIASSEIDPDKCRSFYTTFSDDQNEVLPFPNMSAINEVLKMIKNSKRPLILCGGGATSLRNGVLANLAKQLDIPIVASLHGLDIIPHDNPLFSGFIGSYGNRYANIAVSECDLLLVLGSRLDPKQIGDFQNEFAKNAKIVHVEIDPLEIENIPFPVKSLFCSVENFIKALSVLSNGVILTHNKWRKKLNRLKELYPAVDKSDNKTLPNEIIRETSMLFSGNDIITADVGQNQMWTAQSVCIRDNMRLLNSGGLGSMGFSLPAAIGAAVAQKGSKVLCVSGDGGFQMNLQELNTVSRENLPIKILVMNNSSLGLIRTYQNIVFDNNIGSVEGFSSPDYKVLSNAYGIDYVAVRSAGEILEYKELFLNDRPLLCEVVMDSDTEVHPEPAYKMPVHIQSPIV